NTGLMYLFQTDRIASDRTRHPALILANFSLRSLATAANTVLIKLNTDRSSVSQTHFIAEPIALNATWIAELITLLSTWNTAWKTWVTPWTTQLLDQSNGVPIAVLRSAQSVLTRLRNALFLLCSRSSAATNPAIAATTIPIGFATRASFSVSCNAVTVAVIA